MGWEWDVPSMAARLVSTWVLQDETAQPMKEMFIDLEQQQWLMCVIRMAEHNGLLYNEVQDQLF